MDNLINQRLNELLKKARLPGDGVLATCRRVAEKLSLQLLPKSNWTGSYIHQVANKKLSASKRLTQAINRLYMHEIASVNYEEVVIIAPMGQVTPHTLVAAKSKICRRGACGRHFLPISPAQKYCSKYCRSMAQFERNHQNGN